MTPGCSSDTIISPYLRLLFLVSLLAAPSLSLAIDGFAGFVVTYMIWGGLIALALPLVIGRRGVGVLRGAAGVYLAVLALSIYVAIGFFTGFNLRLNLLNIKALVVEVSLLTVTVVGSEVARSLLMSFSKRYAIRILAGSVGGYLLVGLNYLQAYSRLSGISSNFLTTLSGLLYNVLITDIHVKGGFVPALFFRLLHDGFWRVSPLIPLDVEGLVALKAFIYYTLVVVLNVMSENRLEEGLWRSSSKVSIVGSILAGFPAFILIAMIVLKIAPLVITSGSMSPSMNMGDLVLVDLEYQHIDVGDVIVYYDRDLGVLVAHRVIAVTSEGFVTKGDANPQEDPRVVESDLVLGKIILAIPAIGWVVIFVRRSAEIIAQNEIAVIVVALILLMMVFVYFRVSSYRELIKLKARHLRGG